MIRPLPVSLRGACLVATMASTFVGGHSAQADQIVLDLPITPAIVAGPTDVTMDDPGVLFSLPVAVPQFDPSLGTLESAILTYSVDFLAEATSTTGGGMSASVGGFFALDDMAFTGGGGGNGGGGPPGPLSFEFEMFNNDPAGSLIPFLTELTGTGFSTLAYNGEADITLSGFTGATLSAAGGSFTVTYNFTPVPEPATFVVLASGLLAVTLVARRRCQ